MTAWNRQPELHLCTIVHTHGMSKICYSPVCSCQVYSPMLVLLELGLTHHLGPWPDCYLKGRIVNCIIQAYFNIVWSRSCLRLFCRHVVAESAEFWPLLMCTELVALPWLSDCYLLYAQCSSWWWQRHLSALLKHSQCFWQILGSIFSLLACLLHAALWVGVIKGCENL